MHMPALQLERAIFQVRDAHLSAVAEGAALTEIDAPDWVLDMEEELEAEARADAWEEDAMYGTANEDRDYGVRASETDEFYERNDAGEYINRM